MRLMRVRKTHCRHEKVLKLLYCYIHKLVDVFLVMSNICCNVILKEYFTSKWHWATIKTVKCQFVLVGTKNHKRRINFVFLLLLSVGLKFAHSTAGDRKQKFCLQIFHIFNVALFEVHAPMSKMEAKSKPSFRCFYFIKSLKSVWVAWSGRIFVLDLWMNFVVDWSKSADLWYWLGFSR